MNYRVVFYRQGEELVSAPWPGTLDEVKARAKMLGSQQGADLFHVLVDGTGEKVWSEPLK
jgi:hypothetical protein